MSAEHECHPWDDSRYVALCEQQGWDHSEFVALQERLTEQMTREAAAVTEGFCPRCIGRLTATDLGPWCSACDLYHWIKAASDGCVVGAGATTGSWKRSQP